MDFMRESTPLTSRVRAQHTLTGKHTDHQNRRSPTTTTSSSYNTMSSSDEEEDMANCLIMLAHSVYPLNDNKSDICCQRKPEKFIKIRSVTEMVAASGGVNSDIQSYECKTCNRSFPSFQALGGHRASHKKPKLTVEDKTEHLKEYQPKVIHDVVYEENKNVTNKLNSLVTPDSSQTGHKNISQVKVHQCSICGSEFLSGQALGGHMRRHRTIPPSTKVEVTNMNDRIIGKSPVLCLDLNLPPPEGVEEGHLGFQLAAGSTQQPLVFSATALVDCHY